MPSLLDIRRRVRAVKSTQQITKAMKMVAASRMRRAHDRVVSARPYSKGLLRVLTSLASRVDSNLHPLLAERDTAKAGARIVAIVITGDKGLAGSFNSNIVKAAAHFLVDRKHQQVEFVLVGRKGRDYYKRRPVTTRGELVGLFTRLTSQHAAEVAGPVIEAFASGQVDGVFIIYNEFKSIMTQKTVVEQLLPRYVESRIFAALLESNAAFYAAQMTAMDSATKNSAEMLESLTLYMNKVRQAAITREIIEVVSGAQAL